MNYSKLTEEDLKSNVQQDFFAGYRYRQLGRVDFVIAKKDVDKKQNLLFNYEETLKSILWAEAKQGTRHDIYESFVQLILTIGKERTFEKYLPPKFIGAFDAEKFAFIEYNKIQSVFYQNDFNWNVTPSNHDSKEFKQLYELCKNSLQENSILFKFENQEKEFREFIKLNFKADKDITEKISVTKNNFTFVFQKWSDAVKPTISVDWQKASKIGIISADFFLADLLSENDESLKDSLYVVLKKTKYELAKQIDELGFESSMKVGFSDGQKAYKEFWAVYARPPKEEYWDYIIGRRDLLVPQDIRERKGSFFTPQIWVEKSQAYLADVLGETWQDEYYIWDCCAGTGNLLNGLTNYDNVWASTLDKQDVDVMKDRVAGGWGMAEDHIFQFDFLNDELPQAIDNSKLIIDNYKLPPDLIEVLCDEEKRKKLIVYINPPYAEAANARTSAGTGENRAKVATENKIWAECKSIVGAAANELYAQFLFRIYKELQCCKVAHFATLKALCASNFAKFREYFKAKLEKSFIVPANTFDNVTGKFPIGFYIFDTAKHEIFDEALADVYDAENNFIGHKKISSNRDRKLLMDWLKTLHDKNGEWIGYLRMLGSDVQNTKGVFLATTLTENDFREVKYTIVTRKNFLPLCIYFSVRHCIEATWLNDRDQFLFPNDGWQSDLEFQANCLIYTLFHGQNRISNLGDRSEVIGNSSAKNSETCNLKPITCNHWIPFTREQTGCKKSFKSKFMSSFLSDFLSGKVTINNSELGTENEQLDMDMAPTTNQNNCPLSIVNHQLSIEAQAVYDAGLELWKYYHAQAHAEPNASFYDIRKHFQGVNDKGKMNTSSSDERYTQLISDLREKQKTLGKRIEAKTYEYGFLR